MAYPQDMTKQVIGFYKTTFDNSYGVLVNLQDQAEKMMRSYVDQAPWINEDGRKVVEQWVGVYKKGRDDFKKAVDEGYSKVEELLGRFGQQ